MPVFKWHVKAFCYLKEFDRLTACVDVMQNISQHFLQKFCSFLTLKQNRLVSTPIQCH